MKRRIIWLILIVIYLVTLLLCTFAQAKTIYVDNDGTADFNNIQAAIDDANNSDVVIVKPGIYSGDGNRDIDFEGKAITVQSVDPNDSNFVAATVIDCQGTPLDPHRGFHFHSGEDSKSVIDGLTITNGCMAVMSGSGAGIFCEGTSPKIRNCIITNNRIELALGSSMTGQGGGLALIDSTVVIEDCWIVRNSVAGVGSGGGIYASTRGWITIRRCTIRENVAPNGAGIQCIGKYTHLSISESDISANTAHSSAGGIAAGDAILTNCLIAGNSAGISGGGIFCDIFWDRGILICKCTIVGNRAGELGGGFFVFAGYPRIENSIIYENIAPLGSQLALQFTTLADGKLRPSHAWIVGYTNLKGGQAQIYSDPNSTLRWGQHNIDLPPDFVCQGYWDPNRTADNPIDDFWVDGDYHLKSQAGRWDPKTQAWVRDDITSPCIDAGDLNSPIGHEPFPNGGRINMGAYGSTTRASKSYYGEPICETIVAGDINGDCMVDYRDFAIMAGQWLRDLH